jgi:hypothetical protein
MKGLFIIIVRIIFIVKAIIVVKETNILNLIKGVNIKAIDFRNSH